MDFSKQTTHTILNQPAEPVLMIFLKNPVPGSVKTRLGARIGMDAAAAVYRILVEEVLRRLPTGIFLRLMFSPPDARSEMQNWLEPHLSNRPHDWAAQSEGDLGQRLASAFTRALEEGWSRVGVVGTDCVGFDGGQIAEDLARMSSKVVTLGPTPDGGYWYLSIGQMIPLIFENIPWSTDETLAATRHQAEAAGMEVALMNLVSDIDTLEDLCSVCAQDPTLDRRVRALLPGIISEDQGLPSF